MARKFDEYGKVGHCDMTARLDNFAVALMNEPGVRSFIISYDSPEKKYDYADRQNKVARHYLVHERGIDPARITTVNGGQKNIEHVSTELWVVPEGATPPAAPPETDRHTDKNFSGKFDVYATDENVYREMVELGYSGESISHTEFAEKLKQQPDSLGYLVIRASKNSSPGAWRRLARRDERVLQKEYGVESGRLKSIDGGQSDGDYSEVELWVLPKWAPPLAGVVEKIERVPETAFKVSTYDSDGSPGEDAERWVLENLAEALRESPKAHVCIIAV
ncbi:MAG: hypothetical protein ACRD68_19075, partial [Pyrinomonadaceae bacterium]